MKFDFQGLGDSIFQSIQNALQSSGNTQQKGKRGTKAQPCTPCAAKAAVRAARERFNK